MPDPLVQSLLQQIAAPASGRRPRSWNHSVRTMTPYAWDHADRWIEVERHPDWLGRTATVSVYQTSGYRGLEWAERTELADWLPVRMSRLGLVERMSLDRALRNVSVPSTWAQLGDWVRDGQRATARFMLTATS